MLFGNKILSKALKFRIKKHDLYHKQVCYLSRKGVVIKNQLKPIDMSYISYESTVLQPNDIYTLPVIIMHGLMGSKANWNSLSKVLHTKTQPQRKIIAVDARNHGDSPHSIYHSYEHIVEDIIALYSKLQINKAVLLGHSMGGRAMMLCALKYPELVERLIVVDISPITISPNLRSIHTYFRAMERIMIGDNLPMSTARKEADVQLGGFIKDPAVRQFLITNLIKQEDGKYVWRLNLKSLESNFSRHIANFPVAYGMKYEGRTLFIGGGKSDYIPTSDHDKIKLLFPNSEFQYVPEAGHWVHSERPDYFLKLVIEFLDRL